MDDYFEIGKLGNFSKALSILYFRTISQFPNRTISQFKYEGKLNLK